MFQPNQNRNRQMMAQSRQFYNQQHFQHYPYSHQPMQMNGFMQQQPQSPSQQMYHNPFFQKQHMGMGNQPIGYKPSKVAFLKQAFMNESGSFDVSKTVNTVDQVVKTVNQVSPLVKQVSSLFIKK
ncbi:YppG family protein [Halalkalibacter kiskunsagensis]|uniref:YppG family protein n=1 Tax=Halalkalibacter kiskunsagensis TaxID=1548599 RepID=A0ABV6KFK1_9BACI